MTRELLTLSVLLTLLLGWQLPLHAAEMADMIAVIETAADIDVLTADYNATVIGRIPALSLYRVQAASADMTNLLNDARVTASYTDSTMDARPSYITATGDILEAAPTSDIATEEFTDQAGATVLRYKAAHAIATGEGITVAVLDTGAESDHPLLTGKVGSGYDFIDNDADPADEASGQDTDGDFSIDEAAGHGSHVGAIIGLVAPDAKIMPVRIFDTNGLGYNYAVAQGIMYAVDQGADVINLSGNTLINEPFLENAVHYAWANGVPIVASAGLNVIGYPAGYDNVISVAATNADSWRTVLSNFGDSEVQVYAPGERILSAYHGGRYAYWTGHSMATPFVTGAVALMLSTGSCDHACARDQIASYARAVNNNDLLRLDVYDAVAAASNTPIINIQAQMRLDPGDNATDNVRKLMLQLNNLDNSTNLSTLTMRYWYVNESDSAEQFHCDWAAVNCNNVTGTFGSIVGRSGLMSDTIQYLEIGFTNNAGPLYGSGISGELQLRTHHVDWSAYNEGNDYSYGGGAAMALNEHVTVYQNGDLIWGTEPEGAATMAVQLSGVSAEAGSSQRLLLAAAAVMLLSLGMLNRQHSLSFLD